MRKRITTAALAATVVLAVLVAQASASPADKCEASKNKIAGRYYSCREKAESTSIKSGLPVDYTKCSTKFDDKWDGAETAGAGACPDTVALTADMNAFLSGQAADAALVIAGAPIPDCAGDLAACEGDLSTCSGDLGTCASNLSSTNVDLGNCTGTLGTCNGNLGTCNGNLGTCTGSLGTCNTDLSTTNADLGSCTGTLGTCNASLGTCTGDLGTCNTDLSTTNADLASCAGDLATANTGTAVVGDVLSGKTFTSTAGLGATGTMPNNGSVTLTPNTSDQAIAAGYHDGTGECAGDADLVAGNIKTGVNLFGVTGTVLPGGLQKSGQTICYDFYGTVIACAGTGQDGELQKGVANSFTDNGDGTITDNLTGLMWEKLSDDGGIHDKDTEYSFTNAFVWKVATLNSTVFAGYADWRVPNRKELDSLLNLGGWSAAVFSSFNQYCTGGCTVLTCSCTPSAYFWSSTTYASFPSSAWVVYFFAGKSDSWPKSNMAIVRAVRAGA